MWLVLALSYAISYLHRVAPNVVADQLMESFAVGGAAVLGSLAAMYFYIYVVMQIPAGLLADSLGPRATVSIGMLLAAVGSFLFGLAPSLFFAFVGRFLVGLGVASIFVAILKFQSVWFKASEFAFITGMTILAGNAGAVLATTPLAMSVNLFGWQWSFIIIGLISLAISLSCWLVVRNAPEGDCSAAASTPLTEKFMQSLRQTVLVLKNIHSWPPFFVVFGVNGTLIAFSGIWGIPYLMQVYNLSRSDSASLMMMIAIGMIAGSPVMGFLSDRLQRRRLPYIILVFLYASCWVVMVFWNQARPPLEVLYFLYFFIGFCGACLTLTYTLAKELNPPQMSGMAVAVVNIGAFLGICLLQPLLGYLLDLNWSGVVSEGVKIYSQEAYYYALRFCLYPLALSFFCALLVKETRGRNCYPADKHISN